MEVIEIITTADKNKTNEPTSIQNSLLSISSSKFAEFESSAVDTAKETALKCKKLQAAGLPCDDLTKEVPTSNGVPKPTTVGIVGAAVKDKTSTGLNKQQGKHTKIPHKNQVTAPKPTSSSTKKEGFGNFAVF